MKQRSDIARVLAKALREHVSKVIRAMESDTVDSLPATCEFVRITSAFGLRKLNDYLEYASVNNRLRETVRKLSYAGVMSYLVSLPNSKDRLKMLKTLDSLMFDYGSEGVKGAVEGMLRACEDVVEYEPANRVWSVWNRFVAKLGGSIPVPAKEQVWRDAKGFGELARLCFNGIALLPKGSAELRDALERVLHIEETLKQSGAEELSAEFRKAIRHHLVCMCPREEVSEEAVITMFRLGLHDLLADGGGDSLQPTVAKEVASVVSKAMDSEDVHSALSYLKGLSRLSKLGAFNGVRGDAITELMLATAKLVTRSFGAVMGNHMAADEFSECVDSAVDAVKGLGEDLARSFSEVLANLKKQALSARVDLETKDIVMSALEKGIGELVGAGQKRKAKARIGAVV